LSWAIALIALAIAGSIFWLGRRDLTHPAVAFGVAWFLSVAITQLELTPFVHAWSVSFALMVIGGGLAFVAAATIAAGTDPARGTVRPKRSDYEPRRILLAALVLLASGLLGRWLESRILGGVPLLSGNIDVLRARAYGNGNVAVPAYVTFLNNGFYLGGWCLLAYLWLRRGQLSRRGDRRCGCLRRWLAKRLPLCGRGAPYRHLRLHGQAASARNRLFLDRRGAPTGRLQRCLHRPLGSRQGHQPVP
jgi:hypothetical protein